MFSRRSSTTKSLRSQKPLIFKSFRFILGWAAQGVPGTVGELRGAVQTPRVVLSGQRAKQLMGFLLPPIGSRMGIALLVPRVGVVARTTNGGFLPPIGSDWG